MSIETLQSIGLVALALSQLCLGIAFFVHLYGHRR